VAEDKPFALAGDSPFAADKIDTDINPSDVIIWSGSDAREQSDGSVHVGIRLNTKKEFTLYADKIKISGPKGWILESTEAPPTRETIDPITGDRIQVFYGGDFLLKFKGPSAWTDSEFDVNVKYIGCTKVICLFPYTEKMKVPFYSTDKLAENAPILAEVDDSQTFEEKWSERLAGGGIPYGLLLLIVFLGGILSNLTPCVYPMIPITLRLLANQGKSPYLNASIYASGIVVTYSSLGIAAAMSGGMFGALLASPTFNLVFAVVMTTLAVTMLGFGNFSKLQMIGNKMGAGKASLKNTFLMGAGAGLVAAPCTGPILAALLAYTAKNQESILASSFLLFIYSLGFALPYVLLGGAASQVSQRKVSPKIQVGIKLLFASVMFALGIYYLRVPFYGTFNQLHEIWPTLAVFAGVTGVAMLFYWVSNTKLQNNKYSMLIPSLILGLGIFATSQWASRTDLSAEVENSATLTWTHSEDEAIAAALEANKPIMVDFWAEWCEACKKMDKTTFLDPDVRNELAANWIILKLDLTEDNDANDEIQEKYQLAGLPTLILLQKDGSLDGMNKMGGYTSANKLIKNLKTFDSRAMPK